MSRRFATVFFAFLAPVALSLSPPAAAVTMTVTPLAINQSGTGGSFSVGHFIDARSWYSNLSVSGGFVVRCSDPSISDIRESYSASQTVYFQENKLSMGVPPVLPAKRSLSGWTSVPTGTIVNCTYELQARAVESGINLGLGGTTIPIGNGERSEVQTIPFDMLKVGTFPGPGCIF
jgi:hypothetical protein